MAKDTYYFQHDYGARNDDKIMEIRSEFGTEGYGLFWMIVEVMAENENGGVKASLIGGLSLGFGVAKDRLMAFTKFCTGIDLFYEENGFLFSRRMLKHKNFRKYLSDSGRAGADKKWGSHREANSTPNAKERKEKENKVKKIIEYEGAPDENLCFDIENFLIKNEEQLNMVCSVAYKSRDEVLRVLKKYHLHNVEKGLYPKLPLQLIAGLQKWLINEKQFSNGSHNTGTSENGKSVGANKLAARLANLKPPV